MNANAIYYQACNDCSITLAYAEDHADPKVEEKMIEAGQLLMGTAREVNYMLSCDFCESETDRMIRWDRY